MCMSSSSGTNGTLASNRVAMERFIERFRDSGNVRAACDAAGVSRTTAYRWRDRFATFRAEWDEAKEDACDILEKTAWDRSISGGSDRLLMFLLKAHRREVFGDRIEHQGEIVKTVVQVIGGVDFAQVLPPMPEASDEDA